MTESIAHARPFLKWAGGKGYLSTQILPRLPSQIKTYYEPFVGAGAVFFALAAENRFERAVIGDSNEDLMLAYAILSKYPGKVVAALKDHEELHSEDHYYDVRAKNPSDPVARAARVIYLNRTCFNGLYRVNRKGGFNVPFGRYENPVICDEENLRAVSATLRKVVLTSLDFEETVLPAKRGDVVYFDPPYIPVSETSFTAYAKGGFGPKEHERLRNVARHLIGRGVHVLLSNSDTDFARKLYKGFRIKDVQAPRRMNSKGDKRGKVGELLIAGKLG